MNAIVLCAGYGTRLGDLTREVPKPMLPLGDRPLLEFILCHLRRHGFDRIAINLHFRPEAIRDYFGDGSQWGCRLSYFDEPELLGTAGGVWNMARQFEPRESFLVQYGDILTDQDLSELAALHRRQSAVATILVHRRPGSNSVVSLDERGCVTSFLERPTEAQRRPDESPWVFSGITMCSGELLEWIPPGRPCDLPRDVFTRLTTTGRLFGCPLTGRRTAIDSPERLAEAREAVAAGHYPTFPVGCDEENPRHARENRLVRGHSRLAGLGRHEGEGGRQRFRQSAQISRSIGRCWPRLGACWPPEPF